MSASTVLSLISRMSMQTLLMPSFAVASLTQSIRQLNKADFDKEILLAEQAKKEMLGAYGLSCANSEGKSFAFASGIAIIPVHGVLINRFGRSWGYITGYNYIRAQMEAASRDPDVTGIIFDVDSLGGEKAGCFELCEEIRAIEKPTLSVVDSSSYSAGYAVASSAKRMIVTPSSGVGSVGVIATHFSFAKMLEEEGIEVTLIYSGEHKADGNQYEALPDKVKADIKANVDFSRTQFCTLVAKNRGKDVQAILDTEARTYRADEALELGLIDAIATPAQAVSAFFNELTGSTTLEEISMGDKANATPGAENANATATSEQLAQARKSERERITAITTCEEAKDKPKLAATLANTEMSVEEAKVILNAAASETQAAATTTVATTAATNPLQQAMDATANPNVGADSAAGTDTNVDQQAGSKLLSDYLAATGQKQS